MEISLIATIIGLMIAAIGVGVTIVVLVIRGSYKVGENTGQVIAASEAVNVLRSETREDNRELRADMAAGHERLRAELAAGHERLRAELAAGHAQLRAELAAGHEQLRAEIQHTRAEAKQDKEELRAEIKQARAEAKQDKEELRAEINQARAEARDENRQLRAEMNAGFEKLVNAIDAMRVEIQQTNQMVVALANHTHDTDGRTVFAVPSPPNR